MEVIEIVTRDTNGKRLHHYLHWDYVCKYVNTNESIKNDEILLILVDGTCIYSAMWTVDILDWDSVTGFFA